MSYERMDAVIKQHRDTMAQIHSELTSLQSKVEELKQENEELKEQCIELKDDIAELTTEKQKAMEPWLGDDWEETTLADWADDIEKQKAEITDDYQREIEALEEENKDLKVENELNMDLVKVAGGAVEKLEAKNKDLEEELLYYRMYVYTVNYGLKWQGPEKEDVDRFTDDPQQRKTLYERIGYESDDESDED